MSSSIKKSVAALALAALSVSGLAAAADKVQTDTKPAVAPGPASAAAVTLHIGDQAPAIQVAKWFKGVPLAKFEPGQIYVVEFWATWCAPCLKSIPHLTEMKKTFDGKARILGISIWEAEKKDNDKRLTAVKTFVEKMGTKMDYGVAADDNDGFMAKNWMEAAGQSGIPTAFIVGKDGTIVWVGYPWGGLDEALEKTVAGTLDIAAVKAEATKQQDAKAAKNQHNSLLKPVTELKSQHQPVEAIAALEKLIGEHPEFAGETGFLRFKLLMDYDQPAAYVVARNLLKGEFKDNPNALYSIGRDLTDPPGPKTKDWDLAMAIGLRIVELSSDNPSNIAILSEAYAGKANYAKAVETMELALSKAAANEGFNAGSIKYLQGRLKKFKAELQKTSPLP